MNIAVIGTGYVGLVTGTVFADMGNDVMCTDVDESRIQKLQQGIMPFYEPGLSEMVNRNIADGRLKFSTDFNSAIKKSLVIFIAVGTPSKENGETDLSQVEEAALSIAKAINEYKVIVNKSTVPVGTVKFVKDIIEKNKVLDVDFDVVSNPEFLREGSAIYDSINPDRIIIGAPSQPVALVLLELYATLGRPMIITDVESAELIKYASNAFLATKISFANAIADICEKTGANIDMVIKGVGLDNRIGPLFMQAGIGYGGSCFPKDVKSLIHTSSKFGIDFKLLKSVEEINNERVELFFQKIKNAIGAVQGKTFAILGLSFKPDTDDMREAKSIELIHKLIAEKAIVKTYDPAAMLIAKKLLPTEVQFCENAYLAAENADAMVICTEWREFKLLNMQKIKEIMKTPVIFDGRNLYDPKIKTRYGFFYYGIGRKN
ncbi:MAG: UDP-glucose 6-dehydrogenase [Candidatus Fischerbacteria bacterium RBG_13_37_8]|uniref:UDP-glucose 6-dehydrogenase n=1 Tax=Candidatus Fischerbacteria bacterium RBG_13_37_8 TaxID=1817863 RepID=A0A1F5VTX2_9BACT|nr:MAG: UDP-glucose 6-dehydrogenase [Candidatus Fischerbacteria bacterium RBG_13_37_8]